MRANTAKALPFPPLRPAAPADATLNMDADNFEEDWQRAPGDIAYLHDILQSLEGPPRAKAAGTRRTGATLEDEEVAAQEVRERQMDVIERRRRRARCRCDAVDSAFARSVERRMQAMQHLALDPPAERLVGQGMTQYVPAALLPDDFIDAEGRRRAGLLPLQPHSVVEAHVQRQQQRDGSTGTSASPAVAAITAGPAEKDALVFLTQLDAGEATEQRRSSPHRSSGIECRRNTGGASSGGSTSREAVPTVPAPEEHEDDAEDDDGDEEWMRPSTLTTGNKDRWRELGYHVVVVGGTANSSSNGSGATRRQAPPPSQYSGQASASTRRAAEQNCTATRTANAREASPWRYVTAGALPPVCLVQRRLPEEDLTAMELRGRQPSAKLASRRRPPPPSSRGGDEGRVWRTAGK